MKLVHLISAGILALCFASSAFAQEAVRNGKAKKSEKRPKGREVNITREAQYTKDKKNIDFEAASLYGQRKVPMGSMISQSKSDKNFDLIKIREHWNPEMVQSTSSLELSR
jgi:hypothetical protein